MSVYKRGSSWAAQIDLDRIDGKRRRRYLGGFNTKKEAEAALRKAEYERDSGIDIHPKKVTVGELVQRYIDDRRANGRGAKTLERYDDLLRLQIKPHMGATAVAKLRPAHISALLASLRKNGGKGGSQLAPKSIKHVYGLLRAALRWGVQMQLLVRNPADAVTPPHVPKSRARALTQDEVSRLIQVANSTPWAHFFTLALTTGARRGELAALKWSDVDLDDATVTIHSSLSQTRNGVTVKSTKTEHVRIVPLSRLGIRSLRAQRAAQAQEKLRAGAAYDDSGFVFANPLGGHLIPVSISNAFNRIARDAKISTTRLHDLRHTTATWLITEGVDIRTVGAVLGHTAASTTLNTYSHAVANAQAAAVAKIDERLERVNLKAISS